MNDPRANPFEQDAKQYFAEMDMRVNVVVSIATSLSRRLHMGNDKHRREYINAAAMIYNASRIDCLNEVLQIHEQNRIENQQQEEKQ